MTVAIKVEKLSKAYQLGQFGTGTLSRDLERWWALKRGKEDPFLKVGEQNDRTLKSSSNIVWSLKDIDFTFQKGDAVGIIGRNGAGKSTLLKILSRVTGPTTGNVKVKGRVASLLEVGTGFHPELTGKENIFLNGAILGMKRREIRQKFDEIVAFAGVERYIDTPVKRYSSGMYVRLAFAVAAHLEAEILIVDEVLAVGDAEFQNKCLGKMGELSRGEGRTILFVSHNIAAIRNLTHKALYLKNGCVELLGPTHNVVETYLSDNIQQAAKSGDLGFYRRSERNNLATIQSIEINKQPYEFSRISIGSDITLELGVESTENISGITINIIIKNGEGIVATTLSSFDHGFDEGLQKGSNKIQMKLDANCFAPGRYFGTIGLSPTNGGLSYDVLLDYPLFEIVNTGQIKFWLDRPKGSFLIPEIEWCKL